MQRGEVHFVFKQTDSGLASRDVYPGMYRLTLA